MPKKSARSLTSKFRSLFTAEPSTRKYKHASKKRGLHLERLEEKAMLTTTVFLDFGEGFDRDVMLMTARDLRDTITGPDITDWRALGLIEPPMPWYTESQMLSFQSLESVVRRNKLDYDGNGTLGDRADYLALRDDVIDIVKRNFAPFDIKVEVANARNTADVRASMNANNGDPTGQFDSYVFVTGIVNMSNGRAVGAEVGILGMSSGVDLMLGQNLTDESVIVNAEGYFQGGWDRNSQIPIQVALGNVIAHEAGHSFALHHSNTGVGFPDDFALLAADLALITGSDLMAQGGAGDTDLQNISFFTRNDLMMGNMPFPNPNIVNAYEKLANDPDIGLNPNGPAYITGTGAFDVITIERNGLSSVLVTIEAHRDNSFNSLISTYSYTLNVNPARGILIDAGRSDDRIVIDGTLISDVRIRGGEGDNQLYVIGDTGLYGSYTPDTKTTSTIDNLVSYSGTVTFGDRRIFFEEFTANSMIHVENFAGFSFLHGSGPSIARIDNYVYSQGFLPPVDPDDDPVPDPSSIVYATIITGSVNGTAFPGFSFVDVGSVVMKTGAGNDEVTVGQGGVLAAGLFTFSVNTGAGNDKLTFEDGNFSLPLGGKFYYAAGAGADELIVHNSSYYVLDSNHLISRFNGVNGRLQLSGLSGEKVSLHGTSGADRFLIQNWVGEGVLFGGDGNDSFQFNGGNLDNIGKFQVIGGRGNDDVLLSDVNNTSSGSTYAVGNHAVSIADLDRFFGGIKFDDTLETLRLMGTDGADTFVVTPSKVTEIRVDGRDPSSLPGDKLIIDTANTSGATRSGSLPGDGAVKFSSHKSVIYKKIETYQEDPTVNVPIGNGGLGLNIISVSATAGVNSVPLIQVTDAETGQARFAFLAYDDSFRGGVHVATGDFNGDGIADIVTAPGIGSQPLIRIFDGTDGTLIHQFLAYDKSFNQGVEIAVGDINGDGTPDIITSPSRGAGRLNVFSGTDFRRITSFNPYGSGYAPGFTVAAADVDGDGFDDLITGPRAGDASVIRVFSGQTGARLHHFVAFEPSYRGGVVIAAGDINGDGLADIMIGSGPGGNSRVQVFGSNGQQITTFRAFTNGNVNAPLRMTAIDANFDGLVELYVAQAQDASTNHIRVFDPLTGTRVDTFAMTDPTFFNGVYLG